MFPPKLVRKTANGDLALEGTPVHIKGTVASEADLPVSGNVVGEAYFVVWTGEQWTRNGTPCNGGGYVMPEGGIPKSDLSDEVQNALDLADAALQKETDPIYTADKPTLALKSELPNISGLATKAEVQAVSDIVSGKLDATTQIDLVGTFSAAMPFRALVLKPTTASFETETLQSWMGFMNAEQERMILVLFTSGSLENTAVGMLLGLLGVKIPDDSQGMWVLSIPFADDVLLSDPNAFQLFRITDGTNILIPEVSLAELTGLESADMVIAIDDESGLFQGSFEEENINITSIAGCEICFRFTQAQALQYLLDQSTKRTSIVKSEPQTPMMLAGVEPLMQAINAHVPIMENEMEMKK